MINESKITQAYEIVATATRRAHETGECVATARFNLETAKLQALYDGRIDGKNEEQRKAASFVMFATLQQELEVCERENRQAKFEFELARLELERARALLRLMELATPGE